jgi:hypothetical protein
MLRRRSSPDAYSTRAFACIRAPWRRLITLHALIEIELRPRAASSLTSPLPSRAPRIHLRSDGSVRSHLNPSRTGWLERFSNEPISNPISAIAYRAGGHIPGKVRRVQKQPVIGGGMFGGICARRSHETAEISGLFFMIVNPSRGASRYQYLTTLCCQFSALLSRRQLTLRVPFRFQNVEPGSIYLCDTKGRGCR